MQITSGAKAIVCFKGVARMPMRFGGWVIGILRGLVEKMPMQFWARGSLVPQGVLVERMPMAAVRSVLDCINAAYGEYQAQSVSADAAGRPAPSRSSSVLSPEV